MQSVDRGRLVAGAILILLGIGFFAMNYFGGLGAAAIVFALGAIFLAGYFVTRIYGLLVPGCILLGIGLGLVGGEGFSISGFGSLALGFGFCAIFLIDWLYSGTRRWWPLVPGGILIALALVRGNETLRVLLSVGWPLILVALGLIILFGAFGLTGRRSN